MTANPTIEKISTDQLRLGDVVHDNGMRLVIDRPIDCDDTASGPVFHTSARIDNWTELVAEAAAKARDGITNAAAQFITHRARSENGNHRWTIQGNELSTWWREINPAQEATKKSLHGWCLRCGQPYEGSLQPTCECAGDPPVGYYRNPFDPSFRAHADRVSALRHTPAAP